MRSVQAAKVYAARLSALVFFAPLPLHAGTFYVAPTGNDGALGSQTAPWASMAHAQAAIAPGDTVYFKGGTYAFTAGSSVCITQTATISGVVLSASGTAGNVISYLASPGEIPIFDFSGIKDSCRITGIRVTGSYIYLKGFEITGVPQNNSLNHESWGVWNSGSNNVFELLNTHNNAGAGLYLAGGSNNLVLNCDSHDNYDALSSSGAGTFADGFGFHVTAGAKSNVFRGCRAWFNSNDGYNLTAAQEAVTIESSWAFDNGYLSGTTTPSSGDGIGFAGGGYGNPPAGVPASPPQHTIQNCVSFLNRGAGFSANHHPVSDFWYNDTAYDNAAADFDMLGLQDTTGVNVGILRNDLAFGGTSVMNISGGSIDDSHNSWDAALGVTVSAADFQSVATTGWDTARQADGSLPTLTSLHLASGSDLIDKGINVGLPFNGPAPDLGAFESSVGAGGSAGVSAGGKAGAEAGGAVSTGGVAGALAAGGDGGAASNAAGMGGASNGGQPGSGGETASSGSTSMSGGSAGSAPADDSLRVQHNPACLCGFAAPGSYPSRWFLALSMLGLLGARRRQRRY
jgi:MYXO-CTERM domain-containing protein